MANDFSGIFMSKLGEWPTFRTFGLHSKIEVIESAQRTLRPLFDGPRSLMTTAKHFGKQRSNLFNIFETMRYVEWILFSLRLTSQKYCFLSFFMVLLPLFLNEFSEKRSN